MKRAYLVSILILSWLALAVIGYYAGHKPFSPEIAISVAQALGQFLAALAILSVSGGLGHLLLPSLALRPLTCLAIQAALGLGLLGISLLFIGSTLGISSVISWALLLLLGVILRRQIASWLRNWSDAYHFWTQTSRFGRALAFGIVTLLFFTLTTALAPPMKWDALVYHLTLPRLYLNAGKVFYVPDIMFWGMPQLVEMLNTWSMGLAGTEAAVVLGWMGGVLAFIGILGLVGEHLGTLAAWVSVASLLSGYTVATSLAWGYTDWFTFLFGWGFLVALYIWRLDMKPRFLILMGAFAGFALGTKYTAGVLLLVGALTILWYGWSKFRVIQLFYYVLQFGFWVFLFSSPWWVKNFIATGNPLYPFLVPAAGMSAFRLDWYVNNSLWGDWRDVILLPLRATFSGFDYGPGYNASIGPLMIGLGGLFWLGWRFRSKDQQKMIGTAALVALPGILVWSIAGRFSGYLLQTRLYFAVFPAIVLLTGAGFLVFEDHNLPDLRINFIASALVSVALAFNLIQVGVFTLKQGAPQALLSLRTKEEYLGDNLGWFVPTMDGVRSLPAGSRVLMIWESRSFYCAPKCFPDEILDRWLRDLDVQEDPAKVLALWRQAGFSHLLYYRSGDEFLRHEDSRYLGIDWKGLDQLLAELPPPEEFGEAYELYRLTP
jgi:hypothetical protein